MFWLCVIGVVILFFMFGSGRSKRRQLYDAALKPDNWGNLMPWRPEIGGDGGYWVTSFFIAIGIIALLVYL